MSGHTDFRTLAAQHSPAGRARIDIKKALLRQEMMLHEVREAFRLTQETLGQTLNIDQSAIAKMEKRTDMYVSNLRRIIEAMGGELQVVARFPEGSVTIRNFARQDTAVTDPDTITP